MAKYDFRQSYPGPDGPHLGCLTQFTLTRDETKRGGESIHPRVMNTRTWGNKSNTCKPRTKVRSARLIASLYEHSARHPHDKVTEARLARLTAASPS